jgi:hypothetical protein
MGNCRFCGESAGLLRSEHKACTEAHGSALAKIPIVLSGYVGLRDDQSNPEGLRRAIQRTSQDGFLAPDEIRAQTVVGLGTAIRTALDDRSLSDSEMTRLQEILDQFDFSDDEISASGAREAFVQALILRDLEHVVFLRNRDSQLG